MRKTDTTDPCLPASVLVMVMSRHSAAGKGYLIDPLFRDAVPQSDVQVAGLNLQEGSPDVIHRRNGMKHEALLMPCRSAVEMIVHHTHVMVT